MGRPVIQDKSIARALGTCLTILGLERVIRYALLKSFAAEQPSNAAKAPQAGDSDEAPGREPARDVDHESG